MVGCSRVDCVLLSTNIVRSVVDVHNIVAVDVFVLEINKVNIGHR